MGNNYTGTKDVGQYDFHGACAPREDGSDAKQWATTFTLGIFPVETASRHKYKKRGKVVIRVRGMSHSPAVAYRVAREVCAELDSGRPVDSFKKIIQVWKE